MKCTDKTHMSINYCGHRELAMRIIEGVIEEQLNRPIDGEEYYEWEDQLTFQIAQSEKSCNGTAHTGKQHKVIKRSTKS